MAHHVLETTISLDSRTGAASDRPTTRGAFCGGQGAETGAREAQRHGNAGLPMTVVVATAPDLVMEKSAHSVTLQKLHASEDSYLCMARSVGSHLRVNNPTALRSLAHLPNDQLSSVVAERRNLLQLYCAALSRLHEKLDKKEELLQDYELNLKKLRIAEGMAQDKAAENAKVVISLQESLEESDFLHDSLLRAQQSLQYKMPRIHRQKLGHRSFFAARHQ
ncbi:PREDICTED: uncharacterized protein LOC106814149 [Priapulus caudatus]|uniref:Uncharacterized protein LOC106814149 n=1 Tax=Priapulus caudatus TaxID=37621 RepID=A0ABM1EP07_PRICU|nr:PREDICTED: uncharacterized protein LOC106814149 [Priapulus caudatus]